MSTSTADILHTVEAVNGCDQTIILQRLSCHNRPHLTSVNCVQNIGTLHTLSSTLSEIKDGAIFVKGNVIQWVGKTEDLPAEYSAADDVITLEDRVVIPGMVNTHHHMVQSLTRCVAQVSHSQGRGNSKC